MITLVIKSITEMKCPTIITTAVSSIRHGHAPKDSSSVYIAISLEIHVSPMLCLAACTPDMPFNLKLFYSRKRLTQWKTLCHPTSCFFLKMKINVVMAHVLKMCLLRDMPL